MTTDKYHESFSWLQMARAIWYLLEEQKVKYAIFSIIVILVQFYELVPVFIVGQVVDFFTGYLPGTPLTIFYGYVIFLGVTTAGVALVRLSSKRALSTIQANLAFSARVKGFERLLNFSLKWHDQENTGNKVQRIQNGTAALREIQHTLSNDVFYAFAIIGGTLSTFIFLSPMLLIISLVYLACFLAVQIKFYQMMVAMNDKYNQLTEQASGSYYEGLSNVLTIKTLGVKKDLQKNVTSKELLTRDHSFVMIKIGNNKWKVFQVINAAFLAVVLFMIGQGYLAGSVTLGSIFILFNYFTKLQGVVGQSTEVFDMLISHKSKLARMMPIYWDKITGHEGKLSFPKSWKYIRLTHANFTYKKELGADGALHNINLKIQKFAKIGIVGQSGSGKSTLAKLLLGVYELSNGNISIGTTNYQDIQSDELTKHVALVLQESEMFNFSLRDNITLMREFDQSLLKQAIEISQLQNLIESLPDGLDTLIGEKGYRLSGGERQRIGIARAIYKDPQILVLDEATSSLDTKTEGLIQEAMEQRLQKKTVIIIAHRLTTLVNVDKIYVFAGGKIVEEGLFNDLSSDKNSKFYALSHHLKSTE